MNIDSKQLTKRSVSNLSIQSHNDHVRELNRIECNKRTTSHQTYNENIELNQITSVE